MHVCSRWRRVALDAKCLWSNIILSDTDIARAMLLRSRGAPINLCLEHLPRAQRPPFVKSYIRNLTLAIRLSSRTIRTVQLALSTDDLQDIVSQLDDTTLMPRLEHFKLSVWNPNAGHNVPLSLTFLPHDAFDGEHPRLRSLLLSNIFPPVKPYQFTQLTQLKLDATLLKEDRKICLDCLLDILEPLSPTLQHVRLSNVIKDCSLGGTIRPPNNFPSLRHRQIVLRDLRSLDIMSTACNGERLLSCLRLPQRPIKLLWTAMARSSRQLSLLSAIAAQYSGTCDNALCTLAISLRTSQGHPFYEIRAAPTELIQFDDLEYGGSWTRARVACYECDSIGAGEQVAEDLARIFDTIHLGHLVVLSFSCQCSLNDATQRSIMRTLRLAKNVQRLEMEGLSQAVFGGKDEACGQRL